jgi:hypothetical protein
MRMAGEMGAACMGNTSIWKPVQWRITALVRVVPAALAATVGMEVQVNLAAVGALVGMVATANQAAVGVAVVVFTVVAVPLDLLIAPLRII